MWHLNGRAHARDQTGMNRPEDTPTRRKQKIAAFVGAISLALLVPASGAFADTTQPNACVGQSIHTIAIPSDGNVKAHADAHGLTVQQLLRFIRDVHCG